MHVIFLLRSLEPFLFHWKPGTGILHLHRTLVSPAYDTPFQEQWHTRDDQDSIGGLVLWFAIPAATCGCHAEVPRDPCSRKALR